MELNGTIHAKVTFLLTAILCSILVDWFSSLAHAYLDFDTRAPLLLPHRRTALPKVKKGWDLGLQSEIYFDKQQMALSDRSKYVQDGGANIVLGISKQVTDDLHIGAQFRLDWNYPGAFASAQYDFLRWPNGTAALGLTLGAPQTYGADFLLLHHLLSGTNWTVSPFASLEWMRTSRVFNHVVGIGSDVSGTVNFRETSITLLLGIQTNISNWTITAAGGPQYFDGETFTFESSPPSEYMHNEGPVFLIKVSFGY